MSVKQMTKLMTAGLVRGRTPIETVSIKYLPGRTVFRCGHVTAVRTPGTNLLRIRIPHQLVVDGKLQFQTLDTVVLHADVRDLLRILNTLPGLEVQ